MSVSFSVWVSILGVDIDIGVGVRIEIGIDVGVRMEIGIDVGVGGSDDIGRPRYRQRNRYRCSGFGISGVIDIYIGVGNGGGSVVVIGAGYQCW